MTPTEQNIACAELFHIAHRNEEGELVWNWNQHPFIRGNPIFDPVNDLNACARLVAKLTKEQYDKYIIELVWLCGDPIVCIDATAPQRVVAILRATGKWREES